MRKILLVLMVIVQNTIWSQITFVIKNIPSNTPENAKIYLAGNINNWNAGDSNYVLTKNENGAYSITIAEKSTPIEFKFTRGDWASGEGNASGGFLPNRKASFTGSPQTIEISIASWEDLAGSSSSAAQNVTVLNKSFYMPQLNRYRKVWLYLPPDYQTSDKKYPVLYLHDGQNLFDNATSFSGEWGIDETLNNLYAKGDYGVIVIGIDNGGGDRINEYTPWINSEYGGGQGEAYVKFIAETLKPFVDANYRTLPDAKNTVLGGSSLGGLISVYGMCRFPNVFGKVLNMSPAYWINLSDLNNYIENQNIDLSAQKIYTVAGKTESTSMVTDIEQIQDKLSSKNLMLENSLIKIDTDGKHAVWYWKREFGAAYQWLFSNENLSVVHHQLKKLKISVHQNVIFIEGLESENSSFTIYDLSGKTIETIKLKNGKNILQSTYGSGVYLIKSDQGLYETIKAIFK